MPETDFLPPAELSQRLKNEAHRLGFVLVGVCPAVDTPGFDRFQEWLAAGFDGQMLYLSERADAYQHPRHVLSGARSVVMLVLPYRTEEPATPNTGQGRVSRYAWGEDYHEQIRTRLHHLADRLREWQPGSAARGVVDTAPLMEREFAQLAGLGWIGKNTLLLNRQWGSWFFLAALVTDVELVYDSPQEHDYCGACRACLDACPTGAFPAPYVLDARKCISYLTIELRDPIPLELREGIGDWLFGCDICQDVCPWNRKVSPIASVEFSPRTGSNPIDLLALFQLDEDEFRKRFRHSPLWRARRRGVLRNAAIVLGNQRAIRAVPSLLMALNDGEPLVRGACAWALGRMIDEAGVRTALETRYQSEDDDHVIDELRVALSQSS